MSAKPKCRDCGGTEARVVSVTDGAYASQTVMRHEWLCASCEYLREHPGAPRAKPLPRERRAKLQEETLL